MRVSQAAAREGKYKPAKAHAASRSRPLVRSENRAAGDAVWGNPGAKSALQSRRAEEIWEQNVEPAGYAIWVKATGPGRTAANWKRPIDAEKSDFSH